MESTFCLCCHWCFCVWICLQPKRVKPIPIGIQKKEQRVLDDEFIEIKPNKEKLNEGKNFHKNYRDMSFLFILGTYMLNILDANVSAHLMQFNIKDNLSIRPKFEPDLFGPDTHVGLKVLVKL